jgi:hypothetical protein
MIPSLLQIPSAVSDSKLHSVLPNNGKGDFTFDRSTGATRINKDGLIEEVGYFSSELVQNGNFSELGSELVTNGDFATDSDWIKESAWQINNGKASIDYNQGGGGRLKQNFSFTQNKTYKVVFTISDYEQGNIRIEFRQNGGDTVSANYTGNGTYTLYQVAQHNHTQFSIRALSDPIASIDNVSVKQVDPNDRWVLGTGWGYGDGVVSCDGTQTGSTDCAQNLTTPTGKTYKITYTISEYTSGGVFIRLGSGNVTTTQTSVGTFSEILNGADATQVKIRANSTFVGTISNISVVEVQGDRPRLSYDITNGVVEDKPHLLLEPSSTNLVTFSEDFSQWNTFNITAETNTAINPKGTTGCYRIFVDNTSNSNLFLSTASIGTSYTISIYAKSNNANKDNFQLRIGDSRSSVFTATSEWQRFTYSATATGSNTFAIAIYTSSGTVSSDILIFGAQVETTAYATSYIPTAGTTITRAAETCNNSKPSVNSTEGVLYAEFKALASDSTAKELTLSDGSTANRVVLSLNASNQLRADYTASSSLQARIQDTTTNIENYNKLALKFKVNDFELYVNGSSAGTDTSGSVISAGTLTTLNFDNGAGSFNFYGKVKGLAVYNEALSKSQLMQLTGVTASSIYNNFVTRTASFTVEALNEVKKVIDNL